MASSNIRLEPLNAEAEADALLAEHDAAAPKLGHGGSRGGDDDDDDDDAFKRDLEDLEASESLPPPVTHVIAPVPARMHPAPVIAIWVVLSSAVILMNSWILTDLDFPYPIFLTTTHMLWSTLVTRLLRQFTHLLDDVDNMDMSWDRWTKNIVPIGALFSASLVFSNLAYITLNLSFTQVLKAFTSVAVLCMSVLVGLDHFNRRTTITVCIISLGVAIASWKKLDFEFFGVIFQALAIVFEATRLVAIQKLLQNLRMDPLVALYYFAPVCAGFNIVLVFLRDGSAPLDIILPRVGLAVLFVNFNMAFLLNVAVVMVIGASSALVLTLAGVIKDILLVAGGMLLFASSVSGTQVIGYGIALCGLVVYKTPPDQMAVYIAQARSMVGR